MPERLRRQVEQTVTINNYMIYDNNIIRNRGYVDNNKATYNT